MNRGRSMVEVDGGGIGDGVGEVRGMTRVSRRAVRGGSGAACVIAALAFSACDDSTTDPGPGGSEGPSTLRVDAVASWAYVDLATEASVVTPGDPSTSAAWDVAFLQTAVMLNGGAAGPGEVSGYCLCVNASSTDDQIIVMTPESELAAFEGVDVSMVPADEDDWLTEALAAAIDEWFNYDFQTHVMSAAPENVWLVRAADSEALAKFHVVAIDGPTQEHAGTVTFEYAIKPSSDAPFGETRTAELDVSSGAVYFDLESGEVTDGSEWDIVIEGHAIRVNGGVSGSGSAAAARYADGSFDAITDDTELPSDGAFRADAFGGVFEAHPWYRYNLENQHRIWPTYDVYLVRTGSDVYKVQLIGYYDEADDARHITFRYAQLEE